MMRDSYPESVFETPFFLLHFPAILGSWIFWIFLWKLKHASNISKIFEERPKNGLKFFRTSLGLRHWLRRLRRRLISVWPVFFGFVRKPAKLEVRRPLLAEKRKKSRLTSGWGFRCGNFAFTPSRLGFFFGRPAPKTNQKFNGQKI